MYYRLCWCNICKNFIQNFEHTYWFRQNPEMLYERKYFDGISFTQYNHKFLQIRNVNQNPCSRRMKMDSFTISREIARVSLKRDERTASFLTFRTQCVAWRDKKMQFSLFRIIIFLRILFVTQAVRRGLIKYAWHAK